MRGLIYKDFSIFCKCADRKLIAVALGFSALLVFGAGAYGGMIASLLLAMTVGMQNIASFVSDDKAHWNQYQMALPLSDLSVVASKYLSVLCTLAVSLSGSIVLNLISAAAAAATSAQYDASILGFSLFAAVFVPLLWTAVCLPLTYWFGPQSAQTMGFLFIIPAFFLVKYFEDGAGFSAMTDSLAPYLLGAGTVTILLFALSLLVSTAGYARRK